MKILLVSPRTPSTFWSFSHVLWMIGKKAAFPPLGLLTVAGMLPSDWDLRLVDLDVEHLDDADLAWADAVMISAMIVQEPSTREVIARCRAAGTRVIGGGPLFTTGADRFDEVDCCVVGEAEEIMPRLCRDLESGRLERRYEAERRPDVSLTPLPRWDLIRTRDYMTLSVQSSRGCPFDCEFCDITAVYGRVPRVKSPERFIAELESVLATGWRGSIFVVDDNFIGNRSMTKALLRAMIEWQKRCGRRVTFITEASMNLVDDRELLDLMVQAGFKHVFVGIESPQEESLRECRKVQNTRRDLVETVRTIHRAGIQVFAGFIVGFDADKPDVFTRQRRFIQESGVVTAMVGMLNALPGTRLFTRLTQEGRILRESTGNNVDSMLNFVPTLDRDVLTDGYRRLVRQLYEPKRYYERIATFLRDYRPVGPPAGLTLKDLRAFVASMWVLRVAHRGRRHFWTLVARSALLHRRVFPDVIELAIRGYHFRRIASAI